MTENCATCKFFQESSKYGGSCRRYPPQLYTEWDPHNEHPTFGTGYPFMEHQQWCGEFAAVVGELCPNCDCPLPEGCGGEFNNDGQRCWLNRSAAPQPLKCPRCDADRTTQPCGRPYEPGCPMVGSAHTQEGHPK
jgi:hypothetical protein